MSENQAELPWWEIRKIAELATTLEGIDLTRANEGDIILWKTRNSLYTFKVEKPANPETNHACLGIIHGGHFGEKPVKNVEIRGSTWEGSSLLLNQIKKDMRVELAVPLPTPDTLGRRHKTVTTSPVENLRLLEAERVKEVK